MRIASKASARRLDASTTPDGIIESVTRSQLATVPVESRRRAATGLALMAVLLLVVGVLPWASAAPASVRILATAALLAALFSGLLAWGLARSVTLEARRLQEAELDQTLLGAMSCDCGHDHAADGTMDGSAPAAPPAVPCDAVPDTDCPHTCASCVLAQLR
jgi:hypothetical protein